MLHRREFTHRRRSGIGRYLDPTDIMRHQPLVASDVLRQIPVLRDNGLGPGGQRRYLMRGEFGACVPMVYLDGQFFGSLDDFSLDTWLRPEDLAGIEVYTALSAPIPFRAYSGRPATPTDSTGAPTTAADSSVRTGAQDESCGSIVFWLK